MAFHCTVTLSFVGAVVVSARSLRAFFVGCFVEARGRCLRDLLAVSRRCTVFGGQRYPGDSSFSSSAAGVGLEELSGRAAASAASSDPSVSCDTPVVIASLAASTADDDAMVIDVETVFDHKAGRDAFLKVRRTAKSAGVCRGGRLWCLVRVAWRCCVCGVHVVCGC